MGLGLVQIKQVKVPVSDLQRSVSWYRALLDLDLIREFVEDGVLTGAVLADSDAGFLIGLRHRDAIAGQPSLKGYDLFSIGVESVDTLRELVHRCAQLHIAHGSLMDRGPDGTHLDVPDPDGTVVRFLSPFATDGPAFAGVELTSDGAPSFYTTPRLTT